MTGTPTRLCQTNLTATTVKVYSAVADGRTIIKDILATNTSSGQRTLHVFLVTPDLPEGCLLHHVKIAAGDYLHLGQMYQVINKGESLYAHADASDVTLTISGLERV
jgi:hypothetical protein